MVAFEISVNGKVIGVTGVGERGMLAVEILWHCIDRNIGDTIERAWVHPQGLKGSGGPGCSWPKTDLTVGDEVTVRLVERETVDPSEEIPIAPRPR